MPEEFIDVLVEPTDEEEEQSVELNQFTEIFLMIMMTRNVYA